jgi:hypothetical protein
MEIKEFLSAIIGHLIAYFNDLPGSDLIQKRLAEVPGMIRTDIVKEERSWLISPEPIRQSVQVKGPEEINKQTDVQMRFDEAFNKKEHDKEKEIFVQNAGMILLHPFLKYFFKDLGLLEEDRFKDRESREKAIHLLHYLVTKETYAHEYLLILEKHLCGHPLDEPLERFVEITEEMKNECENLLHAVIKNWSQLKNTSPDGLREGFLKRDGKLIPDDYQPRLIVENKAQDVLLSYLPWGYSIVKLPWMASPLYVDWN